MDELRTLIEAVIQEMRGQSTAPARKVVHALTGVIKPFRGNGTDVVLEQSHQDDEVTVYVTGVGLSAGRVRQLKSQITTAVETLGWFIGYSELDPEPYSTGSISVVPRVTKQVTPKGRLYHVTPARNAKAILRSGLEPRGPRKIGDYPRRKYTPRVYLTTDLESAHVMAGQFSDADYKQYVIFEIDPRKVGKRVVFRDDPETANSVWTEDPIPPDAIRLMPDSSRY